MLSVLDIGISNIGSVTNALKHLGYKFNIASSAEEIENAEKIIFPGVGSYNVASKILHEKQLIPVIRKKVLENKTPILGICLGMQLLTTEGNEGGSSAGLNLISGRINKIQIEDPSFIIPHMGWNHLLENESILFKDIHPEECYYFVHSFEALIQDKDAKVFHILS